MAVPCHDEAVRMLGREAGIGEAGRRDADSDTSIYFQDVSFIIQISVLINGHSTSSPRIKKDPSRNLDRYS